MKKTITLSAVSSAALFFGIHGVASADQVHTVKDDAQLSDIASTFATNSNELKSLNNINSNSVNAGTDLIIPDVDIYEVKAGDSIQGIAATHDLTVEQLYQLNPYLGDVIHPGDLLAISEKVLRIYITYTKPIAKAVRLMHQIQTMHHTMLIAQHHHTMLIQEL